MQPSSTPGQNWTAGRLTAPRGTRDWADAIRLKLVSIVEHLGEDDEGFVAYLELLQEHRAWTLLTKHDGSMFRTIEEFCSYKRPWGLGTPWAKLRPYVSAGLAKRGKSEPEIDRFLALQSVPEAMPKAESIVAARDARGAKDGDSLTPRGEGSSASASIVPHATVERLRAINRAPESVREAYKQGRISQTVAAKLGPAEPTPEAAALIAAIAGEVKSMPARKAVDAHVRERLSVEKSTALRVDSDPRAFASRLRSKFSREWCSTLASALSEVTS
jgi:hypothetical protein